MTENMATDDEWFVQKAQASLRSDVHAAKAWLLTARTLYPRSFPIQFEAYNIEKSNKNVKEVATIIEEMMVTFPQEPQLWREIHSMSEALHSEATDENTVFLQELFNSLPPNLQCHMLLQIAQTSADILPRSRLMLLVLSRYPSRVPEQGVKLIEALMSAEKHSQVQSPVNCYRKYMVCDVLPVILQARPQQVAHKHLYRWLQKAIEFYVSYATLPPTKDSQLSSPTPDLASPTKKSFSGTSLLKRISIPGLSGKESYIPNPWQKLFEVLQLVGDWLEWKLGNFCQPNATVFEGQWRDLRRMLDELRLSADPSGLVKQVLHSAIALFMFCLANYSGRIDPEQFAATSGASTQQLVLLESFKSSQEMQHKQKKLKAESLNPKIHPSPSIPSSGEIVQYFLTALKCWELLHSDLLEKEFTKVYQHWKTDGWLWVQNFQIDMTLYQGSFRDAVSHLQSLSPLAKSPNTQLRMDLQIACCYFCLGNFFKACEMALNVVSVLPQGPADTPLHAVTLSGTGRQLHLMAATEAEVLPFCIQLLITCLREKAFCTMLHDDMSLGHLIILLQFDWPKYESLFTDVVEKIKRQGSFVYSLFFNYVINIDILEEFTYIKTPEGGKVSLDILPTSAKLIAESRTVTRGVNKGVKEDFKIAMERQVARSHEGVETVIRQFLLEERQAIQQSLV